MQAYAVQIVSKANLIKYITTEKRAVSNENYSSLNFIFSSLNNLAIKWWRKTNRFKPTVANEIGDDLCFSSLLETKMAMKNVFIANRDEDNVIAILDKFVSVRDNFL